MRSGVERGQVALPLADGPAELEAMRSVIPDRPVILSMAANQKEYPDGVLPA